MHATDINMGSNAETARYILATRKDRLLQRGCRNRAGREEIIYPEGYMNYTKESMTRWLDMGLVWVFLPPQRENITPSKKRDLSIFKERGDYVKVLMGSKH